MGRDTDAYASVSTGSLRLKVNDSGKIKKVRCLLALSICFTDDILYSTIL